MQITKVFTRRKMYRFALALLLFSQTAMAQEKSGIGVTTSFWTGTKFTLDGEKSNKKQVQQTMSSNKEAQRLLLKGVGQQNGGALLAGIGGALIGWPIGSAIGGGDPAWYLAGIGAGVVALAYPIYGSGSKKIHQAVDLYSANPVGANTKDKAPLELLFVCKNGQFGLQLSI